MSEKEPVKVAKKRKTDMSLLIYGFVLILLTTGLFFGSKWVYQIFFSAPPQVVVYPDTQEGQTEEKLDKMINVLVLGVDDGDSEAEAEEPKRTDAMLLVSFNPEQQRVSILSIPRDTRVILPGHKDPEKINSAYAYGGVMTAKQTVANFLGVPVTHYALADWQAFKSLVDLIGGVDILVEHDMQYDDPYANLHIDLKAGFQHLNGEQAGQYVRYRSDELGDIGRAQRQQKFFKAAAAQLFSLSGVMKIPAMVRTVVKYVKTDMSTMMILRAVNSVKFFGENGIRTGTIYGAFMDDETGSYWNVTEEDVVKSLRELDIASSKY